MPILGDDIGLLGALLSGGKRDSSGLGGLLTPGPSPTSAYLSVMQESPFYQGVPSQSGVFGQIGQALMPLIQAHEAERRAGEIEGLRKVFLDARLAEEKRKQAAAAEIDAIFADPAIQALMSQAMAPGSSQTVEKDGRKLTLKAPEVSPDLGTPEEQAAAMKALGLTDLSAKPDPKSGKVLVSGKTPGQGLAGAVSDLGRILVGQAQTGREFAEAEARLKLYERGVYEAPDGRLVMGAPDQKAVTEARSGIKARESLRTNIDLLKRAAARSPTFAGGGLLKVFAGTKNSAIDGLASVHPELPGYLQKRMGEIRADAAANPDDPRLQQMVAKFNPDGPVIDALQTVLSYDFARIYEPSGRLANEDVTRWLEPIQGGAGVWSRWLGGGLGTQAALDTLGGVAERHARGYEDTLRRADEALQWVRYGRQAHVPSPVPDIPSAAREQLDHETAFNLLFSARKRQMPDSSDEDVRKWVAGEMYRQGYRPRSK